MYKYYTFIGAYIVNDITHMRAIGGQGGPLKIDTNVMMDAARLVVVRAQKWPIS